MTMSSFDLEEALVRLHRRQRFMRIKRQLRFRLHTLVSLTFVASLSFAVLCYWAPVAIEVAGLRLEDFKTGLAGKSFVEVVAIPPLLLSVLIGLTAVAGFVLQQRHRR
jgi:hypothetical protein